MRPAHVHSRHNGRLLFSESGDSDFFSISHITWTSSYPHVCTSLWSFNSPPPFFRARMRVAIPRRALLMGNKTFCNHSISFKLSYFFCQLNHQGYKPFQSLYSEWRPQKKKSLRPNRYIVLINTTQILFCPATTQFRSTTQPYWPLRTTRFNINPSTEQKKTHV